VTITTSGLRNKLSGCDDITMSAPAEARPVTTDTRRPPKLADSAMVVIPVTLASPNGISAFPHLAWAGATGNIRIPFPMHISLVGFHLRSRFSERASSFFPAFSFVTFLGYHCYHRELGHKLLAFPFPNLIMAGSWGGYIDCIYSMEGRHTGDFGFWLKKRCSNATPTSAETGTQTPFLFSSPFSWMDPCGNKAQVAGHNDTPCVCLGDTLHPLLLFPLSPCFLVSWIMFMAFTTDTTPAQLRPLSDEAGAVLSSLMLDDTTRRPGHEAHIGCWDDSRRRDAARLAGTGSR
jgi:hypothetical protein